MMTEYRTRRFSLRPWEQMVLAIVGAHLALFVWIVFIAFAFSATKDFMRFLWGA